MDLVVNTNYNVLATPDLSLTHTRTLHVQGLRQCLLRRFLQLHALVYHVLEMHRVFLCCSRRNIPSLSSHNIMKLTSIVFVRCSVLGDDRLIMSRPVDGEGPLYLKFR
jgi:hypothetical protein